MNMHVVKPTPPNLMRLGECAKLLPLRNLQNNGRKEDAQPLISLYQWVENKQAEQLASDPEL